MPVAQKRHAQCIAMVARALLQLLSFADQLTINWFTTDIFWDKTAYFKLAYLSL